MYRFKGRKGLWEPRRLSGTYKLVSYGPEPGAFKEIPFPSEASLRAFLEEEKENIER